jgi:hypothetical protein
MEATMAEYCITAANHDNKSNHVASSFEVLVYDKKQDGWVSCDPMSAKDVVELLESGNTVITGKLNEDKTKLSLGEPAEVELRISKNKTNYDIGKMPTF